MAYSENWNLVDVFTVVQAAYVKPQPGSISAAGSDSWLQRQRQSSNGEGRLAPSPALLPHGFLTRNSVLIDDRPTVELAQARHQTIRRDDMTDASVTLLSSCVAVPANLWIAT